MIKLSIIIPVYNVEKYLNNCVESIIKKKKKDYEIILVDDGSKDNSGAICDEIKNKFDNIKVIHKTNGGLSSARNAGIKAASGEYLMFIDSDDYLYFDGNFDFIFKDIDYDIIQYKMVYYYEKKDKYMLLKDIEYDTQFDYLSELNKRVSDSTISISACDKIVKRDLIINNNLFFEEGTLSEDIDWSLRLYLVAHSIKALNNNLYVYRQQREGSISTSVGEKSIKSLFNIINKWYNYDYDNNEIKYIYYSYLSYQTLILLSISTKKNTSICDYKKIKNIAFDLFKYDLNYKVRCFCKIKRIIGFANTIFVMKIYLKLKNKGVLKI